MSSIINSFTTAMRQGIDLTHTLHFGRELIAAERHCRAFRRLL
ncbi:MAG: hypothetical protein ABR568_06270 [Pyrinomonadaceae bacterium]